VQGMSLKLISTGKEYSNQQMSTSILNLAVEDVPSRYWGASLNLPISSNFSRCEASQYSNRKMNLVFQLLGLVQTMDQAADPSFMG
jgi:hypothetical protein